MGNDIVIPQTPQNFSFKTSKDQGDLKWTRKKNSLDLDYFLLICDDFEFALKTLQVNKRSKNSVHQRLLKIHTLLLKKMSKLEKSNKNNSNETQKVSSNLSSCNKSFPSSNSSIYSKKSSNEFFNSSLFQEFFEQVNCPFCDKQQLDKFHLIIHLNETCLPFKMKYFKKETSLPYSRFQILPSNCFKCNICRNVIARDMQGYLSHLNCSRHENSKNKASSKSYTDSLFCSVCKFLVPNNFTELNMHLQHEQHNKRRQIFINDKIFQEKKICCIYYKNGEYYCFVCSSKFNKQNNLIEFMNHLMENSHIENLEKHSIKTTQAYCEFCEVELNKFQIWNHFQSLEHQSKILEQKFTQNYFLCLYCSSEFSDLTELSNHMSGRCKEMEVLRKDSRIPGAEALGKSAEMEKEVRGDPEIKEGHCLFVDISDDLDVSDLKNYFEGFGRVISLYNLTGNKFMFVFDEKDTVNKLLRFKNSLAIDNKIITVSDTLFENQSNQSECESDEEKDNSDDDYLSDDGEIKNLFQEVGSHLMKKIETMDYVDDEEILLISQMTLKATVTFSGFRGCQLLLPNETRLNLHCQFDNDILKSSEDLEKRTLAVDSKERIYLWSKFALELINKSPFWEQAVCIPSPVTYLKCVHKRTGKSCTISFSLSDKELTNAFSACLKENNFIKPFLVTLKWWLSTQETFLSGFEYPLIAIILFFLTSKSLVRPFPVPHQDIHSKILAALPDDPNSKAAKQVKNMTEGDISKLFQMFLEFLTTFDFKNYAICFPLRRPVPITILKNILDVTENSSDVIWIMNVLCTWNYTSHVHKEELKSFLELINKTFQEI